MDGHAFLIQMTELSIMMHNSLNIQCIAIYYVPSLFHYEASSALMMLSG